MIVNIYLHIYGEIFFQNFCSFLLLGAPWWYGDPKQLLNMHIFQSAIGVTKKNNNKKHVEYTLSLCSFGSEHQLEGPVLLKFSEQNGPEPACAMFSTCSFRASALSDWTTPLFWTRTPLFFISSSLQLLPPPSWFKCWWASWLLIFAPL